MEGLLRIDKILIALFKVTGLHFLDYLIGLLLLSIICVFIGKVTEFMAYRFNRAYLEEYERLMKQKELLATEAYSLRNMLAYKGLNEEAVDYWGRHFFLKGAISIASLWPVPLALYWLGMRFEEVKIPISWPLNGIWEEGVGYLPLFILFYILTRIAIKWDYLKKRP